MVAAPAVMVCKPQGLLQSPWIRVLRMSGDPPIGVLDVYSLMAARPPVFVLIFLWYDGFNRLEFVLSHILMLPMSVMTFVQAYRVGIAVDFEALMAHLCMLARDSANWPFERI